MSSQTLTELAFALAQSGACRNIAELRNGLRTRGWSAGDVRMLLGPALTRQLADEIRRAIPADPAEPER